VHPHNQGAFTLIGSPPNVEDHSLWLVSDGIGKRS
jgi:hypothetical protein